MQSKERSEEIAEQAREAFAQKNYVEAKKLFEEAATYMFDTYQANIAECQARIIDGEKLQADIATFMATVKLTSIPAFANRMKQRNNSVPVTTDDIPFVIQKIESGWKDFKSGDKKSWLDRKKWSPVEKVLGEVITNAIFDGIKDLPIQ